MVVASFIISENKKKFSERCNLWQRKSTDGLTGGVSLAGKEMDGIQIVGRES